MTEEHLRSIIRNNLSGHKSGRTSTEQAIENIISCVYERPKLECGFGDTYCTIHKNGVKPCAKCRTAYEYELTN